MIKKLQNPANSQDIPIQVFNPFEASKKYSYKHIQPSKELEYLVDSHWSMHWDLTSSQPFKLELASSPFVAFTFSQYGSFVTGINTGVYGYTIAGQGSLYGTLFKPTRFYEIFSHSLSELTNKELPIASIFPEFTDDITSSVVTAANDKLAIDHIESTIRKLPRTTDTSGPIMAEDIIGYSLAYTEQNVNQIARHFKISERSLHKLFHDYVGVGIKWITVRDRLQKAMYISARSDAKPDWTAIALELGYGDQSHFINDFKRIIGMSPSRYHQLLASSK